MLELILEVLDRKDGEIAFGTQIFYFEIISFSSGIDFIKSAKF